MVRARPIPPVALALTLCVLLALLLVLGLRVGVTDLIPDFSTTWRGAAATLGLGEPLDGARQTIVELRLWRALTGAGVGGALGLAGALVQGVFRNGLASPSVLGISGGASLGAIAAILLIGGYGPNLRLDAAQGTAPVWIVPALAFVGALATTFVVYRLAATAGQVSVPALLLVGIAMNTLLGGVQQLAQTLVVDDLEVSRSILVWSFGTLDDRQGWHAAVAWIGLALALLVAPFVARELDLMAAGLEDAEALGVDTARVRNLALVAVSVAAACSVAVAGQIAFVGLVVPHLVRLASGTSHRTLLGLSALLGACFLLGCDVAQRAFAPRLGLQPGVVMSLVGGPFFVWLLWRKRREIAVW